MANQQQGHQRTYTTRRYLDPAKSPPTYVDQELPTITVKLQGPQRRAVARMPSGTIEGSYRITGSAYDLTPGTYSLRVTRLSLGAVGDSGAGSQQFSRPWKGSVVYFYARHSREGTIHVEMFDHPEQRVRQGNALEPVFSVGPGTLFWNWAKQGPGAAGTRITLSQQLEGLLG